MKILLDTVRLDTFNFKFEEPLHMLQEYRRAVCAVLFKRLDIAKTAVFVYRSILIKLFSFRSSDETRLRHEFDIDLYALSRIFHLLIWLGNIFLLGLGRGVRASPMRFKTL